MESGEVKQVHDFCALLGYGADAVTIFFFSNVHNFVSDLSISRIRNVLPTSQHGAHTGNAHR